MLHCPCCRLPLRQVGRYVQGADHDGAFFVFAVCMPCRVRLDRLPRKAQHRLMAIAAERLAGNESCYQVEFFSSDEHAKMACNLLALGVC